MRVISVLITGAVLLGSFIFEVPDASARTLRNPATNISPSRNLLVVCHADELDPSSACLAAVIAATTQARSHEGVGKLSFNIVRFQRLTAAEQLFVLVDLERTARHLQPFAILSDQLDHIALIAVKAHTDPRLGARPILATSGPIVTWAGNLASNTYSATAANYFWMYEDGPGTFNSDCASSSAQCWAHRDNILGHFPTTPVACAGRPTVLAMGAAETTGGASGFPSFTELLVASCGRLPKSVAMTWTRAERLVGARVR